MRSNASTNPDRKMPSSRPDSQNFYRSKSTIQRLNLYNEKPDLKKMHERPK